MNTMTLSDLQNNDDDGTTLFDISNDVFAQARQRLNIFLSFFVSYQRIFI
jgi:hypothetical protein